MDNQQKSDVVVMTKELTFSARIREAASSSGKTTSVCRAVGDIAARCSDSTLLVVIDLDKVSPDQIQSLADPTLTATAGRTVVAVGAHVQAELLRSVSTIPGLTVMTRSQFVERLPQLVQL